MSRLAFDYRLRLLVRERIESDGIPATYEEALAELEHSCDSAAEYRRKKSLIDDEFWR